MSTGKLIIQNNIVVGYEGEASNIVIPEGITAISDAAFKNYTWLKSVKVESSVFRSVGEDAFYGCTFLKNITFKSLRGSICDRAFMKCSCLENVEIPFGAVEICADAFTDCFNLCCVQIPNSVMVIADTAFEKDKSKKLLILCASNSEAEKYADKHGISRRTSSSSVMSALKGAKVARNSIETRIFNIGGHKVFAPNSLWFYVEIPAYYASNKSEFFAEVKKYVPADMYSTGDNNRTLKVIESTIENTIRRLEVHGVFVSRDTLTPDIASAYARILSSIMVLGEYRTQIYNVLKNNLDDSIQMLQYDIESKVTGVGYGVIGDGLDLLTHALDDFRTKQAQRAAAVSAAQQEYEVIAAKGISEANNTYKVAFESVFQPALREATDNFQDTLRDVELKLLKEYGLLEDIDVNTYDESKAIAIIRRADSMDQEYAVGLALKTYPLSSAALSYAGQKHIADDNLLEYVRFMNISDNKTLSDVLRSKRISLTAVVKAYNEAYRTSTISQHIVDLYKNAIVDRCEAICRAINIMADGVNDTETAAEYQCKIEELISVDLWVEVNQIYQILPDEFAKHLGLRIPRDVRNAETYTSLGQRIFEYNDRAAQAKRYMINVAVGSLSLKDKIKEISSVYELLDAQKISEQLRADTIAFTKMVLKDTSIEYTGSNYEEIENAIRTQIRGILGADILSRAKSMHLAFYGIKGFEKVEIDDLAKALAKQYITNQQTENSDQFRMLLRSAADYRQAFSQSKEFLRCIDRAQVQSALQNYAKEVQRKIENIDQMVEFSSSMTEADTISLAEQALNAILDEDGWIVYCYCIDPKVNSEADAKKCMEVIRASAAKTLKNEMLYRRANEIYEKAKNLATVKSANEYLLKVHYNYKDCAAKKVVFSDKIDELTRKRKLFSRIAVIFIACAMLILFTVIFPNIKYNEAIALIDAGNIVEAYETMISLGGYKDSAEKANSIYEKYKVQKLISAKVGDYVFFGTYEQDNNTSNGKEDIEWLVLDVEEGKALVISRYGLDCKRYNESYRDVTWKSCSLREWLNNSFITSAFSADEQAMIPTVTVFSDKCKTNSDKETQDQVFVLSITEVNKYLSSKTSRECTATAYAVEKGVGIYANGCSWWLRTNGQRWEEASYVHSDGVIDKGGISVGWSSCAVRPAMWIDLTSLASED